MKIRIGEHIRVDKKTLMIEEYQKYIRESCQFTLFFNASFRKPVTYEQAKKRFKLFFKYLNGNEQIYFKNYIHCWVFYEKQNTSRRGVHIHALIDRIPPKYAKAIQKEARRHFGEMSEVTPYDDTRGAVYYLARKIFNPKLEEYEFYVINSKVRYCDEKKF